MTCSCGRPTAGTTLCPRCGETLAYSLANTAAYYLDAEPRDQRQLGGGAPALHLDGRQVGGTATMPATQTRWDAWATIVAWTRVTMMERGYRHHGPTCTTPCLHTSCADIRRRAWPTSHTVPGMIRYLARQHHWTINQTWAPDMLDELLDVEKRLRRLVDIPAPKWYAGRCGTTDDSGNTCTAELYATPDKPTVTCPACGHEHDVATRRDRLLEEAQDHLVTATRAAQALIAWTDYDGTETKLVDRIRKWRDRDKLQIHDVTSLVGRDRHLYRLGDIQALLVEHAQRTRPAKAPSR